MDDGHGEALPHHRHPHPRIRHRQQSKAHHQKPQILRRLPSKLHALQVTRVLKTKVKTKNEADVDVRNEAAGHRAPDLKIGVGDGGPVENKVVGGEETEFEEDGKYEGCQAEPFREKRLEGEPPA